MYADIGKESVAQDLRSVDGCANGSAACFEGDLFSAAEGGQAGEDVVHDGFVADEDGVFFRHVSLPLCWLSEARGSLKRMPLLSSMRRQQKTHTGDLGILE